MKKVLSALIVAGALFGAVQASNAVTFASFDLDTTLPGVTPNPSFHFNNGTGVLNLITSPSPFTFSFATAATAFGLPASEVGLYSNVNLVFSTTTNGPGTDFGNVNQPMTNLTFSFVTTQTEHGVAAGTVLLSGTANAAVPGSQGVVLQGADSGPLPGTASLLAQENPVLLSTVTFNSGIGSLNAGLTTAFNRQIAVSYTSVSPHFSIPGIFGSPDSFTAQGNGTFAAESAAVPEPGALTALLGIAVSVTALFVRKRMA
jgi:hypothetical protein